MVNLICESSLLGFVYQYLSNDFFNKIVFLVYDFFFIAAVSEYRISLRDYWLDYILISFQKLDGIPAFISISGYFLVS